MNSPVFAALETLQAKWWEIRLAKLLGKKVVAEDSGCVVTMYKYRGKVYMTNCVHSTVKTGD